MTGADHDNADEQAVKLDERYGRTRQRASRQRIFAWLTGIVFAAVFAAWVIWVAFDNDGATFETRNIGHTIVDNSTARVSFELSVPAGTEASCAVEVQSEDHAIVGWKIVDIPASDRYTRTFTETVRTTELGVTGLIYRCWLN